jgi:hypothetical protein
MRTHGLELHNFHCGFSISSRSNDVSPVASHSYAPNQQMTVVVQEKLRKTYC